MDSILVPSCIIATAVSSQLDSIANIFIIDYCIAPQDIDKHACYNRVMENLPNDWDVLQKSLGASVLQGMVWSEVQESMGRSAYFERSNHWSWVGFERKSRGLRYLNVPYGPTASLNAKDALGSVAAFATQEGFDFVRIEPMGVIGKSDLDSIGAIKTSEVDPEHTQVIDITKPIDALRANLRSGHRSDINGASKRGVEVLSTDSQEGLEIFLGMLRDTAKRAKVTFYPDSYYRQVFKQMSPSGSMKLYLAKADGEPVAGALFYDYNGVRSYAYAGAFQDLNRKHKATVCMMWQAILDAKQSGSTAFDLWGVAPDDNSKHKWAGITSFKKGFGGETVAYLGTYDIPINKPKYKAYRIYKKFRGRS